MSMRQDVIQRELALERGEREPHYVVEVHQYDGERCVNCNVNVYDEMMLGPSDCVPHEPMSYTTETPNA